MMEPAASTDDQVSGRRPSAGLPDGEEEPKSQRTRLEVDVRRAQLLQLGRELFARHAYEELSIGAIARAAGISKGLLYHYFSSKRVFYIESVREAAGELLRQTMPPDELTPLERLRAGIDAYLDYVERHRSVFAAHLWRPIVHDAEASLVAERVRIQFFDRIFSDASRTPIGRNALRGWIGFIEACVVDWIENPELTRSELTTMFVRMFEGIVHSNVNVNVPVPAPAASA
jgi:AcrR family transcriptional regulator